MEFGSVGVVDDVAVVISWDVSNEVASKAAEVVVACSEVVSSSLLELWKELVVFVVEVVSGRLGEVDSMKAGGCVEDGICIVVLGCLDSSAVVVVAVVVVVSAIVVVTVGIVRVVVSVWPSPMTLVVALESDTFTVVVLVVVAESGVFDVVEGCKTGPFTSLLSVTFTNLIPHGHHAPGERIQSSL